MKLEETRFRNLSEQELSHVDGGSVWITVGQSQLPYSWEPSLVPLTNTLANEGQTMAHFFIISLNSTKRNPFKKARIFRLS